jgi:hypothetical protein
MVIEEFDFKKKETNIYKQIVQRSTTCPKVTKFTDTGIFWKLAEYRLIRRKFRNVKGNKKLKIFNKFVNNN